ncbi:ABC transporter substrate-binding protein [Cetobacterium sp. 8H]|uniref:siderophore ABC transporter substrate-binding protein n=1 Tax=Cetobacterium sp. 8H TaxID=2759681 RepID=UPI00163C6275|nr:ABC transporter substrate-binding protein [Cetobacterium sp. 8H]MBC2850351.1 ABC transporter substrate-binding protein [Cetobacterium sp. 8H]
MKKIAGIFILFLIIICGGLYFVLPQNIDKNDEIKIKIEHYMGTAEVVKDPKKVIVFDYGILDILDNSGVKVTGLPKDGLPKFLEKYLDNEYINVGSLKEPNLEKLYEIKPDLIIISGRQEPFYEQLSKIAPTVALKTNSDDYMKSFKANLETLGNIFSEKDNFNIEFDNIQNSLKEIKEKVQEKNLSALVILSNNGKLSAYGLKSRFGIIYDYFGFKPVEDIAVSTHGSKINFEYILEKNPDYIFIVDRSAVVGGDVSANKAFDNNIIKATKASQNENIVFLDSEVWYTATGGLKSTNTMIDEIKQNLK